MDTIRLNYKKEVEGVLVGYILMGTIYAVGNLFLGWSYFFLVLFIISVLTAMFHLNYIQFLCKNCGKRIVIKKSTTAKKCAACDNNHTIEWTNDKPLNEVISRNYKLVIIVLTLLLTVPAIYEFVSNFL